jgi:hypothetical protein
MRSPPPRSMHSAKASLSSRPPSIRARFLQKMYRGANTAQSTVWASCRRRSQAGLWRRLITRIYASGLFEPSDWPACDARRDAPPGHRRSRRRCRKVLRRHPVRDLVDRRTSISISAIEGVCRLVGMRTLARL